MTTPRTVSAALFVEMAAFVAGLSACDVGSGACEERATAPDVTVALSADRACALAKKLDEGSSTRLTGSFSAACAEACGSPYNQCEIDSAYTRAFLSRRPDASVDAATTVEDGGIVSARCPTETAKLACRHDYGCIGGRATEGLSPSSRTTADDREPYTAMAHLEAVSVIAFERLTKELEHLGAPRELVVAARKAVLDERRHAHVVGELARSRGGASIVIHSDLSNASPRDLTTIALENAREGCVRESFAALLCAYAASASPDPEVRRIMRDIARDEAEHAAFSWNMHAWARTRVPREQGERLDAEIDRGFEELSRTLDQDGATFAWAGASPQVAHRLIAKLRASSELRSS